TSKCDEPGSGNRKQDRAERLLLNDAKRACHAARLAWIDVNRGEDQKSADENENYGAYDKTEASERGDEAAGLSFEPEAAGEFRLNSGDGNCNCRGYDPHTDGAEQPSAGRHCQKPGCPIANGFVAALCPA